MPSKGAHQAAFESHEIGAGTAAVCRKSANAGCFSGEESDKSEVRETVGSFFSASVADRGKRNGSGR